MQSMPGPPPAPSAAGDSQADAPYAEALARYAASHPLRLHVPGHGGAAAGARAITDYFGARVADLDVMPMVKGLDLGAPPTALDRSRALAAEAWGARRTWFLTNGASQGNQATILALRSLGDSLLVQRSVHSSVIDGLAMTGANTRFITPQVDLELGIAHGVTVGDVTAGVEAMLSAGRPPAAVYVVSPSYFGDISDISAIAAVAHDAGVPLVVDEAWGAHLGFHPSLPASALSLGADVVISSTHKQGGSLTQSAMLHLADGPYAEALEPLLTRALVLVQTTSESALLLASLDLARRRLATAGDDIAGTVAVADDIRDGIRRGGRFGIPSDRFDRVPGWAGNDPLKIVIDVASGGIDGHTARTLLHDEHGVLLELANASTVVGVLGAAARPDAAGFVHALHSLPRTLTDEPGDRLPPLPGWGASVMSIRDAYFAPSEVVPVETAIGRVSADTLAAYPPGIPNVLPGERVTAEIVGFLRAVAGNPAGHVRGAVDKDVSVMRVVTAP